MKSIYRSRQFWLAMLAVAMSSILFGTSPILVKELVTNGMDAELCAMYRLLMAGILSGLLGVTTKQSFCVNRKQLAALAVFGIMGYGFTNVLLPLSYLHMDMGMATMCHFIYPVLVAVVMIILFREPCPASKLIAIACSLCGIIILAGATSNGRGSLLGVSIAILSGVTYGAYVIAQEKSAMSSVAGFPLVFYVGLFGSTFFCFLLLFEGKTIYVPTTEQSYFLIAAGVMSALAIILLNYGVKILGASTAAFVNMLEPITSVVADMIIYAAIPTVMGWIGCLFMLLAIYFVSLKNKEKGKVKV